MIVITGTGRCGTSYVAQLLESAGVPCGHEAHFGPFGWDGEHANDSSWMAAPYLSKLEDATIVHLVRHPKAVIDSLRRIGFFNYRQYNRHRAYRDFVDRWLPDMQHGQFTSTRVWAADFVYRWIDMIDRNAPDAIVHRIEDEDAELLDKLGIDYEGRELFDDESANSKRGEGGTISDVDLLALPSPYRQGVLELCDRFGYDETGGLA